MSNPMTELTNRLIQTINTFIEHSNQTGMDWDYKPVPYKWSGKEIIGHLCDSAQINLQRFIRCTYEENFKLVYAQNEWVAVQHYQDVATADLLQLWKLLNLQIKRVLDNYPLDRLQVQCDSSKDKTELHTVEWLAYDYLAHLQQHLNQIIALQ